jgi:hypothetical protein
MRTPQSKLSECAQMLALNCCQTHSKDATSAPPRRLRQAGNDAGSSPGPRRCARLEPAMARSLTGERGFGYLGRRLHAPYDVAPEQHPAAHHDD